MRLIVGLGNPGSEYAKTRHNAGFMAIERLAQRYHLTGTKSKFHASVLEGRIDGHRVALMQPTTFMNRSGLSASEALRFYKLQAHDMMVLVDDIALPMGRMRLRPEGSAGGHNGLKDIEQKLATATYPRLRLGIDPPGRVPQVDYVLHKFSPDQIRKLDPMLDRACDAITCWLADGIELAMTRYNSE